MSKIVELPPEDEEEQECPKCPPPGAPAWMATFADMATLLMAFFVLILSFAEFNVPKFKQISGSLRDSFGVQRLVPIVEPPKGTTVLSLDFSPSPALSVTDTLTQQTTEQERPELETKSEDGGEGEDGKPPSDSESLADALREAIENGTLTLEIEGEQVQISAAGEGAQAEMLRALAAASEGAQTGGSAAEGTLAGGAGEGTAQGGADAGAAAGGPATGAQPGGANDSAAEERAAVAEDALRVALRQELGEGLVEVERRDGKVFVTVGAGGAFPSGSATLTSEARDIMSRIAFSSMRSTSSITVSGHTDDVPIGPGSIYRNNWDLAAARSASVVRQLEATGLVGPERMKAVSYGETRPVAPNTSAEARERNRRIEIEIDYGGAP
ncbi:flagellar motor protein MotB [Plastorhodobacter daqingensis]|uniref:Flagellar motor protein MotB n=1 Tax=Plastorhodobacter daqingensis TaxID=1387281 RepID=A0ABW2UIC8_9RHOB